MLRFFGYFEEGVNSSQDETWRIRKCVVQFYLEDDSIHITEPKIENSGIPQGAFVKRHRIPKTNNEYVTLEDLFIGAELAVYGRVIKLVACDDFTRSFYVSRDIQLTDNRDYPVDSFHSKITAKKTDFKKQMNSLKKFMEADLGKSVRGSVKATKKFYDNDGKVLRFYASWDDRSMYGEKKPFIVHYFLTDDTIEICEVAAANSGRDPFPTLLKRGRLPKNFRNNAPSVPRIGLQEDEDHVEFYTENDLKIGVVLEVYGRSIEIKGCDTFTKQYQIETLGLTEDDFPPLQMDAPPRPAPIMTPPPHTGYGTEEDSLGSFLYLMPKVPKRDLKKLMENDGIILRFQTQFVNPTAEDADRIFIISFYAADDTIGIYEKFQRNSGFVGGKFLERCKIVNPDTQAYYKLEDFTIGNIVTVNKYKFHVQGTDAYTQKYLDAHPVESYF